MNNNSSPRLRRRPHKEITNHDESTANGSNIKASNKVDIQSGTDDVDDTNSKNKKDRVGIISSTAKAILLISSLALLLFTIISIGAQHFYAANIKELSDTVIKLHQQINALEIENENKLHLVESLEGKVTEKEIELAWEIQHVHDVEDVKQRMHDTMHEKIVQDIELIQVAQRAASEFAQKVERKEYELAVEENENANLKVQLAIALEELGNARSKLPPPPLGSAHEKGREKVSYVQRDGKDMVMKQKERKLRGKGLFQPGDPIEIIEYQEGGKVALRPGK